MNDEELDTLFAQAREETSAEAGAADRFLARHRAALEAGAAVLSPAPPVRRPRLWPALLAGAAVLTGALVLRPLSNASLLPASAAYDAYQGALGEGW